MNGERTDRTDRLSPPVPAPFGRLRQDIAKIYTVDISTISRLLKEGRGALKAPRPLRRPLVQADRAPRRHGYRRGRKAGINLPLFTQ
jgi:hypothetical protein